MLEGYEELLGTQLSLNGVNGVLVAFVKGVSYKLRLRDGQYVVIPVADAIKAKKLALDGVKMKLSSGRECKLSCLEDKFLSHSLGMVTATWLDSFTTEKIALLSVLRYQRDAYVGMQLYKKYDQDESFLVTVAQALLRNGEKCYKLVFEDGDFEYMSKFDLIDEIKLQMPLERIVRVEDIPNVEAMRRTVVGDAGSVVQLPTMTHVRFWGKSIHVALGQDGDKVVVNDLLDTENGTPGEAKSTNAIAQDDILVAINGVSVIGEYVECVARKINSLPRPIVLSFSKPEQLHNESTKETTEVVQEPTPQENTQEEDPNQTASESEEEIETPNSPLAITKEPVKPPAEPEPKVDAAKPTTEVAKLPAPEVAKPLEGAKPPTPRVSASNAIGTPGESLLSKTRKNRPAFKPQAAKATKPITPNNNPQPPSANKPRTPNSTPQLVSATKPSTPSKNASAPVISTRPQRTKRAHAPETLDLDGISSDSESEPLKTRTIKRKVLPPKRKNIPPSKQKSKNNDGSESIDTDDDTMLIKNKKQRPDASPAKPSPTNASPAQPSLAKPSPAKAASAKPSPAQPSPAKIPLSLENSFLKPSLTSNDLQSNQTNAGGKAQKAAENIVEKRVARTKRIYIQLNAPTLQLSLVNNSMSEYPIVNGFLKGADGKIGQIEADGRVRIGSLLVSANGRSLRGMSSPAVASLLKQSSRPLALAFVNNT
ncbi:hypothetical protein THRCLA_04469 [Thraustotheca clavata]|uniref:PDZ domain-containing protein n=1 Tax=Thraustotheca clavata TaxID=74557 RepID=A0A1V9ZZ02_9STRA|nr:hypothetical protein THRCLA_04469 [Thraustotheca clavata]